MQASTAYTLKEIRRLVPGRPCERTIWRWMGRGIRGIKLGYSYSGKRRVVSLGALREFLQAVAIARGAVDVKVASASAEVAAAEAFLSQRGFAFRKRSNG